MSAGSPQRSGYGYLEQPPREEIVQEFRNDDAETIAVLTRNAYGSLILNTRDLMFIDIDVPFQPPGAKFRRMLKRLFGRREPTAAESLRERIVATAMSYPEYTIRVYETRAGYRCAIINQAIDPTSPESNRLFASFDADPLYVRLCERQQCYRVRMTPKYWRCNAQRPPDRYPWRNAGIEREYRAWEKQYERDCDEYATCRFVDQFGREPTSPQLESLVKLHDVICRVDVDPQSIRGLA